MRLPSSQIAHHPASSGGKTTATDPNEKKPRNGARCRLTTVSRLDWPPLTSVNGSAAAVRIRQQQDALKQKLDKLKGLGINTVFFRGQTGWHRLVAFKNFAWSDMLTGSIGADPGYDPLQFMLDEAHKRGMKVHAWFNPYRVSVNTKPEGTIAELNRTLPLHPRQRFVLHRDWIRTAGDRLVLDHGIPEARDWITSIVAEVVSHYPVDGVQFDDYFYTETPGSTLNDNDTFRRYGQGFASKADWRRNNTQQLIEQVSRTIKQLNPNVEFGVSPAGVWRNRSFDPVPTREVPPHTMNRLPTRAAGCNWVCWIILPHSCTGRSRDAARYDVLAKWWADVVKPTNTRLYIGVALYKVGEPSAKEPDWTVQGGVPELKKAARFERNRAAN